MDLRLMWLNLNKKSVKTTICKKIFLELKFLGFPNCPTYGNHEQSKCSYVQNSSTKQVCFLTENHIYNKQCIGSGVSSFFHPRCLFHNIKMLFWETGCFIFFIRQICLFTAYYALFTFWNTFCGQDAVLIEYKWIYTEFADQLWVSKIFLLL